MQGRKQRRRWELLAVVGKMSNTVGSEWHEGCGEFMEHQDVRADPHGSSVGGGDRRWWGGL
jgi:hypothetical protein